jgi:hypothetical protein
MDVGTYNVVKATCSQYCTTCQGATDEWITTDPFAVAAGGTNQLTVTVQLHSGHQYDDTSTASWSSDNTSVATVSSSALVTGVSVGTLNAWAEDDFVTNYTSGCYSSPQECPISTGYIVQSPGNVTPTVTIADTNPDPILAGGIGTVQVTVNPASNVTLTITSSGTGTAQFDNGETTTTISGTTNVNLEGITASQSAFDLTITASLPADGSTLASRPFTVTSGQCGSTFAGTGGDGQKVCPAQVSVTNNFSISNFCYECTSSCIPVQFDSSFTPVNCTSVYNHAPGSLAAVLASTSIGQFYPSSTDCSWHYLHIQTTTVNAQNVKSQYVSNAIGLQCTNCPH